MLKGLRLPPRPAWPPRTSPGPVPETGEVGLPGGVCCTWPRSRVRLAAQGTLRTAPGSEAVRISDGGCLHAGLEVTAGETPQYPQQQKD